MKHILKLSKPGHNLFKSGLGKINQYDLDRLSEVTRGISRNYNVSRDSKFYAHLEIDCNGEYQAQRTNSILTGFGFNIFSSNLDLPQESTCFDHETGEQK